MAQRSEQKVRQLLQAAVVEFSRAGRDGARIDAIARAAGMNKRLLYHYVGDKSALFDAALDLSVSYLAGNGEVDLTDECCWRMVMQGVLTGSAIDYPALATRLQQQPTGGPGHRTAAERVLARLLPDLFLALEKTNELPAAETEKLATKPVIRLRPAVRSGSHR